MSKIWVTRSEPGASALAELLSAHGYSAWVAPVLMVEPLYPWLVRVNERLQSEAFVDGAATWLKPKPKLVIALSAHAVRAFIAAGLWAHVHDATFLAVGEQTAAMLSNQGVEVDVPTLSSSEGLLQMPVLTEVGAHDSVWILAGVEGRDLLIRHLRDVRGCRVVKFELYRRRNIDVGRIETELIDAVVASSKQGLVAMAEQWNKVGGRLSVPLVVPSIRVASGAAEMGFTSVYNAHSASADATLAVVQRLLP